MLSWSRELVRACFLFVLFLLVPSLHSTPLISLSGVLRDSGGKPAGMATVKLIGANSKQEYFATTSGSGQFAFTGIVAGSYTLTVNAGGKIWSAADPVIIKEDATLAAEVLLPAEGQVLRVTLVQNAGSAQASGGEHLSTGEVSRLPLNERDFSKLLLLAAGTMTDTNGAANFTQQFAVNGQRGSAAVFAMDGADTTDPELGGATFSNFNVDAIQEVQSSSGVMPADTGHGAAGFTNVITKSGSEQVHGSLFEFVRNASFDARNFFDHKNDLDTRRLPAFARNEFGAHLRHIFQGCHADRSGFFPARSSPFGKGYAISACQPQSGQRANDEPGSDRAKSRFWRQVSRPPTKRGHEIFSHGLSALQLSDDRRLHPQYATVHHQQPDTASHRVWRRTFSGL